MTAPIPLLDLATLHRPLMPAFEAAFHEIVQNSSFIGGKYVQAFEEAFARMCGTKGCVGVANGTDALMLALKVLGVGAGDTVLVPALTFIATAEAVTMIGATPHFVDVDPVTYTMDPVCLEAAIRKTDRVKAVIPVHLYGQAATMDGLLRVAGAYGLKVIEDCAQAHGATYKGQVIGSFGDLAAFSFYPTKNLGAIGDAGAIVGSNDVWLGHARSLGNHGRITQNVHGEPGINSRLDALQAAVLGIKLPYLRDWNGARSRVAGWYTARFAEVAQRYPNIVLPAVGSDRDHVYHQYVIQVPKRDMAVQSLAAKGVSTGVHYSLPLHLQAAYSALGYRVGDFPVAERVASRCVSLPMDPSLTESQVDRVVAAVVAHLEACTGGAAVMTRAS